MNFFKEFFKDEQLNEKKGIWFTIYSYWTFIETQ
jgi:hypothetical protein